MNLQTKGRCRVLTIAESLVEESQLEFDISPKSKGENVPSRLSNNLFERRKPTEPGQIFSHSGFSTPQVGITSQIPSSEPEEIKPSH